MGEQKKLVCQCSCDTKVWYQLKSHSYLSFKHHPICFSTNKFHDGLFFNVSEYHLTTDLSLYLLFFLTAGSKILVKDPRPALGTPSPKLSGKYSKVSIVINHFCRKNNEDEFSEIALSGLECVKDIRWGTGITRRKR